jgi:pyrroloquinoline quinone biosynthesis protein B
MVRDVRGERPAAVDRAPVDGVFLTHAHLGHYLGLAFFGFEAVNTKELPVYATPRLAGFLRENGPWSQLVRLRNIDIRETAPGEGVTLPGGVTATPVIVPHRDEFSDTVGYRIVGPALTVLYVPDTEPWRTWKAPLPEPLTLFEGVDVAILDATFFSPEELPGRHASSIGHPLMTETMDLLEERVRAGTLRVYFTHINHSNPVLDPASPAAKEVERRGFRVLRDGEEIGL